MEIALSPREIQIRIRSGEPLDEVAHKAGVTPARINAFAAPVFAERANATAQAKLAQVRRSGEPVLHRDLGGMVADRLTSRGIDPELVAWDATRGLDRLWTVRAVYMSGSAGHEAIFRFDPRGRFSVAANDDARWLISENTGVHGPQPGRGRSSAPDENEPTLDLRHSQAIAKPPKWTSPKHTPDTVSGSQQTPPKTVTPDKTPDFVGSGRDMLYDMLSGMGEDSVKIYTGLVTNVAHTTGNADLFSVIEDTIAVMPAEFADTNNAAVAAAPPPRQTSPGASDLAVSLPASDTSLAGSNSLDARQPITAQEPTPTTPPKRKPRKRASVPTWDEIMFGSPQLP
ncbi:MAG: DUF3071 domain-containing protein [Propionibacteriaceae bacterium]|jgi:hypothetical protein|nr:DUF3071 domain-containing protein [Propionibacteriaceae bacterium]